MKLRLPLFFFFFWLTIIGKSQSGTCENALVFCGSDAYQFPTSTSTTAQIGPCYLDTETGCVGSGTVSCACLGSEPNPAWYFMQIGSSGTVVLRMSGLTTADPPDSLDIDFICWGPFTSPTGACLLGLTCEKAVSCSYSWYSSETCIIPNAQANEFYMLMITNFSQQEGFVTFRQSNIGQPGAGTTNCNIVLECSMLSLSPVPTACNPPTNTYSVSGTAEFTNPPATGTLTITDVTATPPKFVVFNAPFTSPLPYTITDIPCDGLTHSVTATFSANAGCTLTKTYTAPPAACPAAVISGGGGICDNGTSQTTVNIALLGTAPFNFTYALNGADQPPVINYTGVSPYPITTSTAGTYTMVSVSDQHCATGTVSGSAVVSLIPLPAAPVANNNFGCGTGSVTLTASLPANHVAKWYDQATGGTLLFTGNVFATPSISVTTSFFAASLNEITGCTSAARTEFIAEIRPVPAVSNTVTTEGICSGASPTISLVSTPAGSTFSWTAANPDGRVNGFTSPGSGSLTAEVLNINTGIFQSGVVTYTVTPTLASCAGGSTPFTITVNPIPTVHTVVNHFFCHNAATTVIPITGDVSGTVFNWVNDNPAIGLGASGTGDIPVFTANNPASNPVFATITVTPVYTNAGATCTGTPSSFTITVNPIPTVNAVTNQVLCHNTSTSVVSFSGDVTGTVYNWVNSDISIGLAATGSGDIAAFTATNTTIAPVTATITVTPQFTNGAATCTGTPTLFTITVNPIPTVDNVIGQVICVGSSTSLVTFSGFVPGTVFNWVNDNPAIGLGASGSGNITSFVTTNTTNAPITATITVTPQFTNAAVTCTGTPTSFTITVNPIATVNAVANQVLCHNTSTSVVSFSGDVTGTVYNWINSDISIGLGATGSGDIAAFTATNTTSAPVTSTITVTPSFTNSGVTCTGTPTLFTITVNPIPTVDNVAAQVICVGSSTSLVTFSGFVPGTVFNWVNDNPAIGLGVSGTGNIPSFVTTNTTNAPITATITVTPSFTNSGVTCTGIPTSFTITVNPIATVNAVANQLLCNAAQTAPVVFSGFVPGTLYSWVNNNTSIGLGASGTGDIPAFAATNLTNAPVIATITVTPSFTNSGVTCTGTPTLFTITVNPGPSVICNAGQTICSGNNTLVTPLSSSVPSGVNYTWEAVAVPPTLYGFAATGSSLVAIPSEAIYNPEVIQGSVTYTVTAHFGSCVGTTNTHLVLVNPSPTVTPSPINQNICSGFQSSAQINFSANVSPTTFTWVVDQVSGLNPGYLTNGITDNIPAQTLTVSGALQGFVKYKIIPSSQISMSCPGAPNYATIFVNPVPSPIISGDQLVCELGPNVTYSTPDIPGHSYLWTVTGGTITSAPNQAQITVQWGAYTLSPGTLTVAETIDATACVVTTSAYGVVLQQRPVPSLTGPQTVCEGDALKVYVTDGGMSQYDWQINGGSFTSGGTPGSSSATVTWTSPGSDKWIQVNYVNSLGCPGYPAKQIPVLVNPLPNTTILGADVTCESQTYNYNTPADPSCTNCTYTWSINPPGRGSFTSAQGSSTMGINWVSSGAATVSVVGLNNLTSCTSSHSFNVTINPKPQVTLAFCFDPVTTRNAKEFRLRGGSPVSGVFTGGPAVHLSGGAYFFNPVNANTGNNTITYTYTNVYGCPAIATANINVLNLPAFSCGTTLTDVRDPSKTYTTAFIGNKCWMTKNLDWGSIKASGLSQTNNCLVEKYCLPTDANCTAFGGLYQWDELMKYESTEATQGLCPPEWHVPTEAEWIALINSYNGNSLAGAFLKDQFLVPGFKAVLGNILYLNNTWAFPTFSLSMYWSSKSTDPSHSLARGLNALIPSVSLYPSSRANAFPVRCVHD